MTASGPLGCDRAGGEIALVCAAALPLGLAVDRARGLLPALTTRCGGAESLWDALAWHWLCMPTTCLAMLLAPPAWIGLKLTLATARNRAAPRGQTRRAVGCHLMMLAGMAAALDAGPKLAPLVGATWTSGAALAAMAGGMLLAAAAGLLRPPAAPSV